MRIRHFIATRGWLLALTTLTTFCPSANAQIPDGPGIPAGPATPAGPAGPAAPAGMHQVMIHDDFVGKDAFGVSVPQGWNVSGQIVWAVGQPVPTTSLLATSADKTLNYAELPQGNYKANTLENMDYLFPGQHAANAERFAQGKALGGPAGPEVRYLPATPKDYLTKILIPKYHTRMASAPDLQLISDTDLPEYAKGLTDKDPGHRPHKASRVRFRFTSADGPTDVMFICVINSAPMPQGKRPGAQPPAPELFWTANVCEMRAPAGKLDEALPTLLAIRGSKEMQLPWFNVMTQIAQDVINAQREAGENMLRIQRDSILTNQAILRSAAQAKSDMVSQDIRDRFALQMLAKEWNHAIEMRYILGP